MTSKGGSGDASPSPIRRGATAHVLWALFFVVVAAGLHLAIPATLDADTGYHFAVARLIAEHGILEEFPWTTFSWHAERYADKELLFHLAMVPLADLSLVEASRIVGALLDALILLTLYFVATREGVRGAGTWVLVALASSGTFLFRLATVRPHLLSITLSILCLWALVRRRWVLLAVVGVLFPLSYTAWHLPLAIAVLVEAARLASRRTVEWKPPTLLLGAVALGILVHPNFPRNLELFWIQNVTVLFEVAWGGKVGFEMGPEFDPYGFGEYLRFALLPSAFAVAAALRSWRRREEDEDVLPLAASLVALGFVVMTLRTSRFIEYLVPFACLALALTAKRWRPSPRIGLLAAGLGILLLFGQRPLQTMFDRGDEFPPEVVEELRRTIPRGSQVVTCDWGMTGRMILELPDRRFMVALDPVFFWIEHPDLYERWFEIMREPEPGPADDLEELFGADYVLCDTRTKWARIHGTLSRDPGSRLVSSPGVWRVYEIR